MYLLRSVLPTAHFEMADYFPKMKKEKRKKTLLISWGLRVYGVGADPRKLGMYFLWSGTVGSSPWDVI